MLTKYWQLVIEPEDAKLVYLAFVGSIKELQGRRYIYSDQALTATAQV